MMKPDISVTSVASRWQSDRECLGTCGYGRELSQFYDLGFWGLHGEDLTLEKRLGNPTRGLQNA